MNRFKILLSGLFFIYLILDGFTKNSISFYIAVLLAIGIGLDWYLTYREKSSTTEETEDDIISPLSDLMRGNGLEMRVRQSNAQWNVTFIKIKEKVVHIVGKGSAPSIAEAIVRAENDFEKHHGNETS